MRRGDQGPLDVYTTVSQRGLQITSQMQDDFRVCMGKLSKKL